MFEYSFMNTFGDVGNSLLEWRRRRDMEDEMRELRRCRILILVAIGAVEAEMHAVDEWLSEDDDSSCGSETESLSSISSISFSSGEENKATQGTSPALLLMPALCALISAVFANDKKHLVKDFKTALKKREAAKATLSAIRAERQAAKRKTRRRLKRGRDDNEWMNMTICYKKKARVELRNPSINEEEKCDPLLVSNRRKEGKERKLKVSRK